MEAIVPVGARRAIRRSVDLPVELVCAHRDEPLPFRAHDLSSGGLWIRTSEPIRAGSTVVVCFTPSGWTRELMVFAEVARVTSSRRPAATLSVGMGLEFLDLSSSDAERLEAWLRQRKLPVPRRRRPVPRHRERQAPSAPERRIEMGPLPEEAGPAATTQGAEPGKVTSVVTGPVAFRPPVNAWR